MSSTKEKARQSRQRLRAMSKQQQERKHSDMPLVEIQRRADMAQQAPAGTAR